jgi:hypothetical protein
MKHIGGFLVLLAGISGAAAAGTVRCDFEEPAEFESWSLRTPHQDALEPAEAYASSGERSAVFRSPKWEEGMEKWPAFEVALSENDWSEYTTLVIDMVNPTDTLENVSLMMSDSDTPFREGGKASFTLQPRSYLRAVVDLSSFPSKVDRSKMAIVHFFTTTPAADYRLHLDAMTLLKEGENAPEPPQEFVRQVLALAFEGDGGFVAAGRRIAEAGHALGPYLRTDPETAEWAAGQLAEAEGELKALQAEVEAGQCTLDRISGIRQTLANTAMRAARVASLAQLRHDWGLANAISEYAVGFATSMEKVLPRDVPVDLRVENTVNVRLARHERESFQVAVAPFQNPLEQVRVEVGDLATEAGVAFPAECIDVDVVGFVKTGIPPYAVDYTGWWPDPLLNFLAAPDVAKGDVQTFWVRVYAPKGQAPGTYSGTGRVVAANAPAWEFDLSVEVLPFMMPDASPLPTAIDTRNSYIVKFMPDWDTAKFEWVDFLADYYIDFDSLYRRGAPDFEILRHLEEQERLVRFNLCNFDLPTIDEEKIEAESTRVIEKIRPIYEEAKKAGIVHKSYIYGFDERRPEYFPSLRKHTARMREEFPESLLMTTAYDHSYGVDSQIDAMGAWVPLTPQYDLDKAEEARKRGTQVWWYICCSPPHPFANWFVEYPAIDTRLLMGFMTARYRPDGFLYYAIQRWPNNEKPIVEGPFTTWNPASFRTFNGDGSITCPGPNGRPLPTIRLENFRDGLEDYAYVLELERKVAAWKAKEDELDAAQKAALAEAEAALWVPLALVENLSAYSRDPGALYEHRNRIADAILRLMQGEE